MLAAAVAKDGGTGSGPASKVHVLLVDDERLTRTVLSSLLHKCGYRGENTCVGRGASSRQGMAAASAVLTARPACRPCIDRSPLTQ